MPLGDYVKTVFNEGAAPGISATRLNNNENKTAELDAGVAAHLADYTLQIPYAGTTTGTANTYAIATPITALTTGMAVSVKFNLDSTGASTLNWNGKGAKGIKKANGTDASLKATGIYTLRYDGVNFILQGEGVSGNATAPDLLSGKTAGADVGDIVGAMPDRLGPNTGTLYVTNGNIDVVPPIGYYGGSTSHYVHMPSADLIATNILSGKNIFGMVGTAKKTASGSGTMATSGQVTVTGLTFQPSVIDVTPKPGNYGYNAHINVAYNPVNSIAVHLSRYMKEVWLNGNSNQIVSLAEDFVINASGFTVNTGSICPVGTPYDWSANE